jgi:Zinc finger C-x8-C-x5-C-x3-H type (and similar)
MQTGGKSSNLAPLNKSQDEDSEALGDKSELSTEQVRTGGNDGALSEGEIFVPRKGPKKRGAQQNEKHEPSHTEENPGTRQNDDSIVQQSGRGKKRKTKVCDRWRLGKCMRGKRCQYLHTDKKTLKPDRQMGTEMATSEKPESLYAAVYSFDFGLTTFSYWRVRWKEKI